MKTSAKINTVQNINILLLFFTFYKLKALKLSKAGISTAKHQTTVNI